MRSALSAGLFAAALAPEPSWAQLFSPGPLTEAHAELEGLESCTRCHVRGGKLDNQRCLDCHPLIETRLRSKTGWHGRSPVRDGACARCHLEHKGRSFPTTRWEPLRFRHDETGWPLAGAHVETRCRDCHQAPLLADDDVRALVRDRGRETFLGAPRRCAGCHEDPHRGQLGDDCGGCHDAEDFRASPRFDHDRSRFPLAGQHRSVDCEACHPIEADVVRYTPVAFDSCVDCHRDPHEGRFEEACRSCHGPEGWDRPLSTRPDRFHETTRYPLLGAHRSVPCDACHLPLGRSTKVFRGLPHEECSDCHLDAHDAQVDGNCDRCHDLVRLDRARFDWEDHQAVWPLEGDHQATPCADCHRERPLAPWSRGLIRALRLREREPLRSRSDLAPRGDRCLDCHDDAHAGQLPRDCQRCHEDGRWTIDRFDHATARFSLDGAHRETRCEACHLRPEPGAPVRYRPLSGACATCHPDPHLGQLSLAPGGAERDCGACHGKESFRIETFPHGAARFALEGRHAELPCDDCHAVVAVAPDVEVVRYRPLPLTCAGCHVDAHDGAFGELP